MKKLLSFHFIPLPLTLFIVQNAFHFFLKDNNPLFFVEPAASYLRALLSPLGCLSTSYIHPHTHHAFKVLKVFSGLSLAPPLLQSSFPPRLLLEPSDPRSLLVGSASQQASQYFLISFPHLRVTSVSSFHFVEVYPKVSLKDRHMAPRRFYRYENFLILPHLVNQWLGF